MIDVREYIERRDWNPPPCFEVGESLNHVCDAITENQKLVDRETEKLHAAEVARLAEAGEDTTDVLTPMHESDHVQVVLALLHEAVLDISEHLWPGFREHQKIRMPEG